MIITSRLLAQENWGFLWKLIIVTRSHELVVEELLYHIAFPRTWSEEFSENLTIIRICWKYYLSKQRRGQTKVTHWFSRSTRPSTRHRHAKSNSSWWIGGFQHILSYTSNTINLYRMYSVYTASTKKLFPSLLSECLKKNIFSAALINRTFGSVAYLSNYSMHLSVSVISPKAEKTVPLFKLSWHLPTTFNFICSLLLSNLGRKFCYRVPLPLLSYSWQSV